MRVLTRFILFLMLTVLVSAVGILVPAADAQTIHCLQVIMNGNSLTGPRHAVDMNNMQGLMNSDVQAILNERIPTAKIEKSELLSAEGQATGDNILTWIQNVQPGPDDVVFVYFSGSAGADTHGAKELYLVVQKWNKLYRIVQGWERLYRREIVKAMEGLNCRLKILITDTGSSGPSVSPSGSSEGDVPLDEKAPVGGPVSFETALHNLFFEHEGFLNISATSEGEQALGDSQRGGFFTRSLVDTISETVESGTIDFEPHDGFVSWSEIFELTQKTTMGVFEKEKEHFSSRMLDRMQRVGQTTQTPKYFGELPKRFVR